MNTFNILDYGASFSDRLQTKAIQAAIDACFLAGGGRVVIPCGVYLTGDIRIRSNVELYLEAGAILKGSRNPEDYMNYLADTIEPVTVEPVGDTPKTRASCVPTSRWSNALIRALDAHDFSIIGEKGSYIDGANCYDPQGENKFRGPHCIAVWRAKNMHFEGYTIINSSNWAHAIFRSQNIVVRNVGIYGGFDGVDLRTCDNVLIEDCNMNTGDDCVAGFDNHDIIIRNCTLNTSCMPLRFAGNNVLVENCVSEQRNFGQRIQLSLEDKQMGNLTNETVRHESKAVYSYYCDFRADLRKTPENFVVRNCRFAQSSEVMRLEFTGLNRWCVQRALKEITFENCYFGDLFRAGMLWGDAQDKVICRFKNVTFACRKGMEEVPLLAAGNFQQLLFEDCTFIGYDKPTLLVGTDDRVEVVRSGEIECRKASFEECIAAHPGGIAFEDIGKNIRWDLKK